MALAVNTARTVAEAVGLDNLLCLVDDVGHIDLRAREAKDFRHRYCTGTHSDDFLGARPRRKHAEDAGAAANVEDDLVPV
jgi:hypothetical protein